MNTYHERGHGRIETSPLICSANQCTGFYMIRTCVIAAEGSTLRMRIAGSRTHTGNFWFPNASRWPLSSTRPLEFTLPTLE